MSRFDCVPWDDGVFALGRLVKVSVPSPRGPGVGVAGDGVATGPESRDRVTLISSPTSLRIFSILSRAFTAAVPSSSCRTGSDMRPRIV